MPIRTIVTCIIVGAVAVWAVVLSVFMHSPLSQDAFAPIGTAISTMTVIAVLFEKFAWRWRLWRGWLVERVDLQGTWKARLKSNFIGPDGPAPEKTVYAVVRQSLTTLSLRLYTDKASSTTIASSVYKDGGDLFSLSIAYQNVPDVEERGADSEIHYGAALFTHIDWETKTVKGHYWTDRETKGSLVLLERHKKCVSSFDDATKLFVE